MWSYVLLLGYLQSFSDHQRCRRQVGQYLRTHLDRAQVVFSADIGAIAYEAMDFDFLDAVGLASVDVLQSYRNRTGLDPALRNRLPRVAADTWTPSSNPRRGTYKAAAIAANPSRLLVVDQPRSQLGSALQDAGPLFKCQAGGIWFAVGPIGAPAR